MSSVACIPCQKTSVRVSVTVATRKQARTGLEGRSLRICTVVLPRCGWSGQLQKAKNGGGPEFEQRGGGPIAEHTDRASDHQVGPTGRRTRKRRRPDGN